MSLSAGINSAPGQRGCRNTSRNAAVCRQNLTRPLPHRDCKSSPWTGVVRRSSSGPHIAYVVNINVLFGVRVTIRHGIGEYPLASQANIVVLSNHACRFVIVPVSKAASQIAVLWSTLYCCPAISPELNVAVLIVLWMLGLPCRTAPAAAPTCAAHISRTDALVSRPMA